MGKKNHKISKGKVLIELSSTEAKLYYLAMAAEGKSSSVTTLPFKEEEMVNMGLSLILQNIVLDIAQVRRKIETSKLE